MSAYQIPNALVRQAFLRDSLQCFIPGLIRAVKDTCEISDDFLSDCDGGIRVFGEGWSDEDAINALASARNVALQLLKDDPGSRWADIAGLIHKAYDDLGDTAEVEGDVAASAACEILETLMREAAITTEELLPVSVLFDKDRVANNSAITNRALIWNGTICDWRIGDGEADELSEPEQKDFSVRLAKASGGALFIEIETIDGPMGIGLEMDRGAAKFWTYPPTGPGCECADDVNAIVRVDARGTHVTAANFGTSIEHVLFDEDGAKLTGEWEPAHRDETAPTLTSP